MEPMTLNRKIFCALSSLLNMKFIVQKKGEEPGRGIPHTPRKKIIEYIFTVLACL